MQHKTLIYLYLTMPCCEPRSNANCKEHIKLSTIYNKFLLAHNARRHIDQVTLLFHFQTGIYNLMLNKPNWESSFLTLSCHSYLLVLEQSCIYFHQGSFPLAISSDRALFSHHQLWIHSITDTPN